MATSLASISAPSRPTVAAYRSAMARAEATASSVVPGATRIWPISPARNVAPGWITPSTTTAAASPVPMGTNNALPAPAAAPNVASATPAVRTSWPTETGRPRSATRRSRTGTSRHPIVTESLPTPASSTIPGTCDADPGDVEVEVGTLVDQAGGSRGDVVEHRFRAVLPTAGQATKHAQSGRTENPGLQRRPPDVDGDDRDATEVGRLLARSPTQRRSSSSTTLNVSDTG